MIRRVKIIQSDKKHKMYEKNAFQLTEMTEEFPENVLIISEIQH